ncbi:hypothetical protein NL676_035974 [Syzygium grande]|nr:hypothetical protein NL676_035974 [Syzygium grande]
MCRLLMESGFLCERNDETTGMVEAVIEAFSRQPGPGFYYSTWCLCFALSPSPVRLFSFPSLLFLRLFCCSRSALCWVPFGFLLLCFCKC